jgi:hypothetical protein
MQVHPQYTDGAALTAMPRLQLCLVRAAGTAGVTDRIHHSSGSRAVIPHSR